MTPTTTTTTQSSFTDATVVVAPSGKSLLGQLGQLCRGGACQDSHPMLFFKVGVSAAVEAMLMLGALRLGDELARRKIPVFSLLSRTLAAASITLFSAAYGALADGGLSAATQQVLQPNATPGDPAWYSKLRKPAWNPPGWLFPIMWLLIVKPTQAAAIVRVMNQHHQSSFPLRPLAVFCSHLALGDAWNKVFFGLQCPGRGAAVITVFYATLLVSLWQFADVDVWAGRLLWPAVGWISVATALNWSIFVLNNNKNKGG